MRAVPWWGVVSAAVAPVMLIGGWSVATALQPGHFDQVTGTISALAGYGAADRWVMTSALAGLGLCYLLSGLALRPAAVPGRLLLMAGGLAVVVVAANPLPADSGRSLPHGLAAAASFGALAIWPAGAWRKPGLGSPVPGTLRLPCAVAAATVLSGQLAWFAVELMAGGGQAGLAERVLAGAQALWPLVVVLSARRVRAGQTGRDRVHRD